MEDVFEKYRKRLKHVGIFRAVALGLAVALLAVGAAALITLAVCASIAVIACATSCTGVVVMAVATPLFYRVFFRPDDREVARRLDALGLDERAITMYECKGDVSGMAELQRRDAEGKVLSVDKKRLKYTAAIHIGALLVLGMVFAASTTTISVIAADGIGGHGSHPVFGIGGPAEEVDTFTVTYAVCEEGTGTISGEAVQEVAKGGFTSAVTAVPASGYRFAAWVDADMAPLANQNNPRNELNVREDITVYALFERSNAADPDDPSEGGNEEGGDREPEKGNSGEHTDEPELPTPGGDGQGEGEGDGGDGSGSFKNNNVIDGTQDYKDNFDREELEKELEDKDVPEDLKDILGDYYDTLKP